MWKKHYLYVLASIVDVLEIHFSGKFQVKVMHRYDVCILCLVNYKL